MKARTKKRVIKMHNCQQYWMQQAARAELKEAEVRHIFWLRASIDPDEDELLQNYRYMRNWSRKLTKRMNECTNRAFVCFRYLKYSTLQSDDSELK